MTPRRCYLILSAAIAGLAIALAVIVATQPARCGCVYGGHYDEPVDPSDCDVHGATTP